MLLVALACAAEPSPFVEMAPCPASPNCVSSTATDDHAIAPLAARPEAIAELAAIVRSLPRTEIVVERPDYLRATFTSALFRFVDDVEFRVEGDLVQLRSASRVGQGDLGVNRARIEQIRALYDRR